MRCSTPPMKQNVAYPPFECSETTLRQPLPVEYGAAGEHAARGPERSPRQVVSRLPLAFATTELRLLTDNYLAFGAHAAANPAAPDPAGRAGVTANTKSFTAV